jgi:methylmalonyl-CoA mutase C-terminal domain/subunit
MPNKRIILAKIGLDSHDNGLRIIARWLMEGGYEVIYAGVYNSPEGIVNMAIQENVRAIGVSFLGGSHLFYTDQLLKLMKENEVTGVAFFAGGVIPARDIEIMKSMGVQAVLRPGTRREEVLETIAAVLNKSEGIQSEG